MPPRIRTRASKALKENIDATENKLKSVKSNTKEPRKALSDKTNSASDDTSLEIPTKSKKTVTKSLIVAQNENGRKKNNVQNTRKTDAKKPKQEAHQKENTEPLGDVRPRRDRRLPTRFVENPVLINLCNVKETLNATQNSSFTNPKVDRPPARNESETKSDEQEPSPFKTPGKADGSLLASRPRRICRLPSRFEDHSISPNKYIPIQPANASTPIQQSKIKPAPNIKENINKKSGNITGKNNKIARPTRLVKIDALQKESSDNSSDKSSPDSNNNAKGRSTRKKVIKTQQPIIKKQSPFKINQSPIRKYLTPINKSNQSPVKTVQPALNKTKSPIKKSGPKESVTTKRIKDKNLSFKLLGDNPEPQENHNKDDIYEFTFDPDEEPIPQKRKRKRTVVKKPSPSTKSRRIVYKSSYDKNISKALAALKNAIKPGKSTEGPKLAQITENSDEVSHSMEQNNVIIEQNTNTNIENKVALNDTGKTSVHECNYPSIRVEDIAADIEPSMDHHDDINYSPVNSPKPIEGLTTPNASVNLRESSERNVHNTDPLNLQEELSFFDDQPVASSSMNMSVRHPLASPWRVEFGSLPIKWHVNAHVKPNMTPAVESSFISAEDSIKKKHVYTNLVPQTNDMCSEIIDDTPNLKQTSIISFIKEMAEKSARKKRERSVSTTTEAIYEEVGDTNMQTFKNKKSTKKASTQSNNTSGEVTGSEKNTSNENENSKEERRTRKRKNERNYCDVPAKSPRKQKDKDCTYFGFDESENQDSENLSPIKMNNPNPRSRTLRPRSRMVLQEIYGPARAVLPVAAKTKVATSSEAVNKVYELKSAADAPVFPQNNVDNNETNIEDLTLNEDSQSVHLFEDIEVVHYLKPTRKSYGKAKKVTFRQHTTSDSDSLEGVVTEQNQNESSDYDDLGDLTFEVPDVKQKKITKKRKPKKLMTKKEEKQAEEWAANFNSMCEDIEEFPLLVE